MPTDPARRGFLRFLAASPLMAIAQEPTAKDALSVLDFEPLAKKALPPAHWGYMATGEESATARALGLHVHWRGRRSHPAHESRCHGPLSDPRAAAAGRGETGS